MIELQSSSPMLLSEMFDGGKNILHDAPEAQNALLENHTSLLEVSEYCYQNYIQSGKKSALALEETKKLTNQSLASVAYQINSLASSVLSLLDAQANQLLHLESSINLIGQAVEMHHEKVARREIGVFTSMQRIAHGHKILPPTPKPAQVYSRCPINYQLLDHLGHGVKISGRPAKQTGTIRTLGTSLRTSRTPEIPQFGALASSELSEPAAGSSFKIGKQVEPPTVPALTSPDSTQCGLAPGSYLPGEVEALPPPPNPPGEVKILSPPLDSPGGVDALPPPPDPPGDVESLPPPPDSPEGVEALPPPPDPPGGVEVLPSPLDSPERIKAVPPPPDLLVEVEVLPPRRNSPGGVEVLSPQPNAPLIIEVHPQNAHASSPISDLSVTVPASVHLPGTLGVAEVQATSPELPEHTDAASPGAVKFPKVALNTRGRPPRRIPLSSSSLRGPSGSARHRSHTRSLFLPSLIIPPPPPYPAPSVPSQLPPPPPRFCLPARLEHLDLEILTPPPCLQMDNEGGCNDLEVPPSLPPSQPH